MSPLFGPFHPSRDRRVSKMQSTSINVKRATEKAMLNSYPKPLYELLIVEGEEMWHRSEKRDATEKPKAKSTRNRSE